MSKVAGAFAGMGIPGPDAWKDWSEKLTVRKLKFSVNWRNGYSPYKPVENAMQRVERAMRAIQGRA